MWPNTVGSGRERDAGRIVDTRFLCEYVDFNAGTTFNRFGYLSTAIFGHPVAGIQNQHPLIAGVRNAEVLCRMYALRVGPQIIDPTIQRSGIDKCAATACIV